jgi:ribosomal protein S18 acetylase RimI-like enzyme
MRFEPLTNQHIPEAVALAQDAYARERAHVPALDVEDVTGVLTGAIGTLVEHGHGVAAVEDGRLLGYMAFFGPYGNFWGTGMGCFTPLHGHGAAGPNRTRLTSLLFQHAAEVVAAQGTDTFAITTYRHDHEAATALALNGFGIRNADAIREIDRPLAVEPTPGITYAEIAKAEAVNLLPLKNGLVRHLRQSPAFVANDEFTPESFAELLDERPTRFFVARDGDTPVGYMELADQGESYLSAAPDMQNICGAFLLPDYRGRGIYQNLLRLVLDTLRDEGFRRVGVDFETMNPTALNFWPRYFDVYTHSYARRIDDLGGA